MATTRYATVTDLQMRVAPTGTFTDPEVERYGQALEDASRLIDSYCRRFFGKKTVTRTFTAHDSSRLVVPDLVSITTLKTDTGSDGTYDTTWATTDYILRPSGAADMVPAWPYTEIEVDYRTPSSNNYFPSGVQEAVEIAGVWGWPEIPADIKQVCIFEALRTVQAEEAPSGVVANQELGTYSLAPDLHPSSRRRLNAYRRIGLGGWGR